MCSGLYSSSSVALPPLVEPALGCSKVKISAATPKIEFLLSKGLVLNWMDCSLAFLNRLNAKVLI